MSELIRIEVPEFKGLEKSKAKQIKDTFEPMVKMLSDFETALLDKVIAHINK